MYNTKRRIGVIGFGSLGSVFFYLYFWYNVADFLRLWFLTYLTSPFAGCAKNDPTCFCQNFVKSPPNLIIFGKQIAKTIELC